MQMFKSYSNYKILKFWFFSLHGNFHEFLGYTFEIFCIAHWSGKSLHFTCRMCQYFFCNLLLKCLIDWFIIYLHIRKKSVRHNIFCSAKDFLFCYLTNFKTRLYLRLLHLIEKSCMLLNIKKYQKLVFSTA